MVPVQARHSGLRHLLHLILLAALHLGAVAAEAGAWRSSMVHTAWRIQDGAPAGVFGMTQDQSGMLWFAAVDGVYRFDGIRFERYTAISGQKLRSVSANSIISVGAALWVGYNFGGVSVFDRGQVRHYGAEDGLPMRTVHRLAHTADGAMWASIVDGLYQLEGQRWRAIDGSDGLPRGRIVFLTDMPDGSLLVNHPDGRIYRNTPGGRRFRMVLDTHGLTPIQQLTNGDAVFTDQQRHFWRYAAGAGTLTALQFPPGVLAVDPFLDLRGALWINPPGGLTLLGQDRRPLRVFGERDNVSGRHIVNSLTDREGNLWLTTESGVDRIRESRLTTIALPPRMLLGLSVQSDRDGTIWIGNHKIDDDTTIESFGLRPDGSRVDTPLRNITATTRVADGSLWFANNETLWRRQDGRWRSWPLPSHLRGSDVQALAMDGAGRLWVSVIGKGVHMFQDGRWSAGGGDAALGKRTAVSLYADPQGQLWFGYPDSRLAVLRNGVLREYGRQDGLDVGNVTAITSRDGLLWVAGDEGVAALRGQRFAALLDADGLSLNGVSGMVLTRSGDLWLNGVSGLSRIGAADLASGKVTRVDRFDHLDGRDSRPHHMRPLSVLTEAPDGKLWYAVSSSVGWVDPAHLQRKQQAPAALLTALRTDQRSYELQAGLALPERTTNLEFHFTAATLGIPERVHFRYRLAGLEEAWREAGTRRAAFYTNLGPGDYRFEVLASNEDGVWGMRPATFSFSIAPAFVQTIWFKLLCAALALAVAALLYRRRMVLVTRRIGERLRERLRERERIARTLHDNFLQSVQALMMQFDLIKHGLGADHPLQARIEHALDTADDVLREGREQVLALRLNHEQTGDLELALSGLGHILGERHETRFTLEVVGTPKPFRATAAAEAYAIGREALLNALRHSGSEQVRMELRYGRTRFTLQVSDQGQGMDAQVVQRGHRPGHFGLTGMRERAQEIGGTLDIRSQPRRGTTVTLHLPARRAYLRKAMVKAAA